MKQKILSLALACALLLSLAACGGAVPAPPAPDPAPPASETQPAEPPAPEAPAYEPATVRVAYMPNLGSAASLFVAMEQGYFEQFGLTVEPYEFQGGPAEIAAMASGDIDISQIGHGAHALCIEGQAVIFQMEHTSLADAVVGNRSKGVSTAADLAGKTVAVSSGTSSEILLQLALKDAGLTMDDIKAVEMDANGIVTAMVSGQVDACATWSPGTITIKEALGDDYVTICDNATYVNQVTFPSSFITTNDYAAKNQDILVRFSAAINLAHDYRAANIEAVASMLAKKLDAPEDTMLQSVGEGDWATISKIAGDMNTIKSYYANQQQVFIDGGRITENVPVEDYVLFDVMQQGYDAYAAVK